MFNQISKNVKTVFMMCLFVPACTLAAINCPMSVMSFCGASSSYITSQNVTINGCGCYNDGKECVTSLPEYGNPYNGNCCEQMPDESNCFAGQNECFSSGCANWCNENKCTNATPIGGW